MNQIPETDIQVLLKSCGDCRLDEDLLLIDDIQKVPFPQSPRRMSFIILGLCLQGEVSYTMDTRQYTVKAGETMIVSERHIVDNYMPSDDLKAICMIVSVKFFHEIIRNVSDMSALFLYSRYTPVVRFDEKQQQVFRNYFSVIQNRIADSGNHFRRQLVCTLMLALFYDLSNVIFRASYLNEKSMSRPDAIFTKFIKLVEVHCRHERRVSWYAQQLCITPKYLSETVKQVSRRTPNEWIDNYVTSEIRVLLKNSTKTIKEITKELNFPNQSFLGKYFKENVGMSPSKYRKS
jgi:AraC-like DNA-binding protein